MATQSVHVCCGKTAGPALSMFGFISFQSILWRAFQVRPLPT